MSSLSIKQGMSGIVGFVGVLMTIGGGCAAMSSLLIHSSSVLFHPVLYAGLGALGGGIVTIFFSAAVLSDNEREELKERMKSIIPFQKHDEI